MKYWRTIVLGISLLAALAIWAVSDDWIDMVFGLCCYIGGAATRGWVESHKEAKNGDK